MFMTSPPGGFDENNYFHHGTFDAVRGNLPAPSGRGSPFHSLGLRKSTMPGLMLDTNVFNHLIDGRLDLARLQGRKLFATHVQIGELRKTPDEARRNELLALFEELNIEHHPTSSMVAGISVAGGACASDGKLYESMRGELNALNKGKRNNSEDILIAETAIVNGLTLLTGDRHLIAVTEKFGGSCEAS